MRNCSEAGLFAEHARGKREIPHAPSSLVPLKSLKHSPNEQALNPSTEELSHPLYTGKLGQRKGARFSVQEHAVLLAIQEVQCGQPFPWCPH